MYTLPAAHGHAGQCVGSVHGRRKLMREVQGLLDPLIV